MASSDLSERLKLLREAAATPSPERSARAAAVRELFNDHNQTLVRFLKAKVQDEQEARDLAQEAYVRLLELERTGAVSFLRSYLFRIAFNLAMDRLRSRKAHHRINTETLLPIEDLLGQANVEKHVFAADELARFWVSLEELPALHRDCFVMSRLEGLATPEIALRTGKSARMVQRYVLHAFLYCRHRMNGLTAVEATERMHDD